VLNDNGGRLHGDVRSGVAVGASSRSSGGSNLVLGKSQSECGAHLSEVSTGSLLSGTSGSPGTSLSGVSELSSTDGSGTFGAAHSASVSFHSLDMGSTLGMESLSVSGHSLGVGSTLGMVGGLTASDDRHSLGMGGTSFVVSSSSGLHFPDTDGASLGVMSSNFRCVFLSVSESVSVGSLGSSGMASLSVSVHSLGMSGASLVKADGSLGMSGSSGLHFPGKGGASLGVSGFNGLHSPGMGGASLGVTSSNGLHSLGMSDTSSVSSTFGSEDSGTVSSRSDGSSTGKVSASSGSGFSLSSSKGFQGFGSSEGRGLSFGKSGTGKGSASLGNLGSSNTSSFHDFGHTFLVSKGSGSEVFSSPLGSDVSEVLSTDFRGKGSGFSFNDGMESLGMSDSSTSSSTFGSEDSGMVSSSSSEFSTGIGSVSSST